MRLALVVGLSTVVDQASGLKPPSPGNNLVGVTAQGQVGGITISTSTGSGSPLGILLTVTNP